MAAVSSSNSSALIACDDIDGFLVGGCSLKADFMEIIRSCPAEWDAAKRTALGKRAAENIQSIGVDGAATKQAKSGQ